MEKAPGLLWKYSAACWFAVLSAGFFLLFSLFYDPFGMQDRLDMERGISAFNTIILTCIIGVSVMTTRTLMALLRSRISTEWWAYLLWCLMEITVTAAFMALFLALMDRGSGYFPTLATCIQYSSTILVFPYTILTMAMVIAEGKQMSQEREESQTLARFYDSNKLLKLTIASSTLMYIKAEENYLRIFYLDAGNVKDFQLRSSMTAVAETAGKAGLFRCHRSYYINPSKIKALRRESNGTMSAEIESAESPIPVSKKLYQELTAKM